MPRRMVISAPYRVAVNSGAAAALTTAGNKHGFVLKAMCPGQVIYIGVSSSVTTANGYPMNDGETLTLEVKDAAELYAIADADNQSLAVLPFTQLG